MLGLNVGAMSPFESWTGELHQDQKSCWMALHCAVSCGGFHAHLALSWTFWYSSCIESPGVEQSSVA